jgi:hypothetical protein
MSGAKRNPHREWAKTAFATAVTMGVLCLLLFKAPFLFGYEALWTAINLALFLPGMFFLLPFGIQHVMRGHGFSPVYLALGVILTWLFYSQLVYSFICWRRRKREAAGGVSPPVPSEDVKVNYWDRWR